MFPHIEHLSDFRRHVSHAPHIQEYERDHFTVFNYNYATYELFDNPYTLECRGIKFDHYGRILARPFHKFFNISEGGVIHNPDEPHLVYEKLDGSMIHWVPLEQGGILACSKMGDTDVSRQAARWIYDQDPFWFKKMVSFIDQNITLIFEWTSPQNRIVLHYPKPELTLLAARHIFSGEYLSHSDLEGVSRDVARPLARPYQGDLGAVRDLKDKEGVVIVYHTGHRLKLKAEEYVRIHRVKDQIALEKNALNAVLSDDFDDFSSILPPNDADELTFYWSKVHDYLDTLMDDLFWFLDDAPEDQKEFALKVTKHFNKFEQGCLFKYKKSPERTLHDILVEALLRYTTSQSKLDEFLALYPQFPRWRQNDNLRGQD